jgi:alkanesulfonate monooxygenase
VFVLRILIGQNAGIRQCTLYFGGSSQAAVEVAAKYVHTYLSWGEPPKSVGEKIAKVKERAAELGRTLRFGVRLHVVARDSVDEARMDAERLIQYVTPEVATAAQSALGKYESEGQKRMLALQKGGRDGLWLRDDLWAGVGLVRGGAGTAMVGDGPTIAALMNEYIEAGIDTFVLSGYPHLEEAYHFAELVFPLLPRDRKTDPGRRGEVIANGAVRVPGGANGSS